MPAESVQRVLLDWGHVEQVDVPLVIDGGITYVRVVLNGREVLALLDTGSTYSLFLVANDDSAESMVDVGSALIWTGSRISIGYLNQALDMLIGDLNVKIDGIFVAERGHWPKLKADFIISAHMLHLLGVRIDFARQRMYICKDRSIASEFMHVIKNENEKD